MQELVGDNKEKIIESIQIMLENKEIIELKSLFMKAFRDYFCLDVSKRNIIDELDPSRRRPLDFLFFGSGTEWYSQLREDCKRTFVGCFAD